MRTAQPRRDELGPGRDHQKRAQPGQPIHEPAEHVERRGVDPMCVLQKRQYRGIFCQSRARLTFRGSLRDGGSAQPTGQGVRGEFQENPLADLLDGRQPMRTFGERRAANRDTDVLEVFRRQRSRLEAREPV
jgi:hypothetical protein